MKDKERVYSNRKKTRLVLELMNFGNLDRKEAARALGCSLTYLNNKMHRNSFSFNDILVIARACGLHSFMFVNEKTGFVCLSYDIEALLEESQKASLANFFGDRKKIAYETYKQLKQKAEELEQVYRFNDTRKSEIAHKVEDAE